MHSLEEKEELQQAKTTTLETQEKREWVFALYKKYCNPNYTGTYLVDCECSNSIKTMYWVLINWFDTNIRLFPE